ncbi:MAG: hypothetical protein ABI140_20435 [Jatrophihabitantaceae bacterium]
MPEPLVCEDSDLTRLMETVHSTPGARILYQDTVRRGGVLGFFAREVHRVAYEVAPAEVSPASRPTAASASTEPTGAAEFELSPAIEKILQLAANAAAGPTASAELPAPPAANSFEALLRSFDETSRLLDDSYQPATELAGPVIEQPAPSEPDAFSDLLAATEAAESAANADGPAPDFAELLRRLTTIDPDAENPMPEAESSDPAESPAFESPAFESPACESPAFESRALSAAPGPAQAERTDPTRSVVTQLGRPDARSRLEMLMQLRQLGVPVSVNPRSDTHNLYQALEDILAELPAPVEPPRQAGAVIAIVGESSAAMSAANTVARTLRIAQQNIGVAGLPEELLSDKGYSVVSGPREAGRLRRELSLADTPSIVVIATDTSDPADPWAREMLAVLGATTAWAVVDARWKTDDSRAHLSRLGPVDALIVHAAELSVSPASVWDLDLPLALLDGRVPTTFAWTGLLCRLLATDARHRATA